MREADPERAAREAAIGGDPRRGSRDRPERLGTFRIGSVLSRAFAAYGRNALPFVVISLVVHLPLLAYLAYGGEFYRPVAHETPSLGRALTSLEGVSQWAGFLLSLLVTGPLAFGVFEQLRGRPPSVGACVVAGIRAVPRALGVAILLTLMLAGVVVAAVLAFIPLGMLVGLGGGPMTALLFGYLLLVAVAFAAGAVMARHAVAVPAAVVERVDAATALTRSRGLTRRNGWRLFGLWALVFVFEFAVSVVLVMLTGGTRGPRPRFSLLVDALVNAVLWRPLFAVALAICYHDLRVTGEGVDTEDLARVFE